MSITDEAGNLAIEECDEKRCDMRAIDIGIGHDDHAFIAQILLAVALAHATTKRLQEIRKLLVLRKLCRAPALATFKILPRKGSTAWVARSRACLAEPPAESPSTRKISVPCDEPAAQSASLPGKRSLRVADCTADFLFLPPPQAIFGLDDHPIQKLAGARWRFRQPMIEVIAHGGFDQALRFGAGKLLLGLALKFGLANEHRKKARRAAEHILGQNLRALLVADELGITALERACKRGAQARFVRAAFGGRDRVAVGVEKAVAVGKPGDRPFDAAVLARLCDMAGERFRRHGRRAFGLGGEKVL